jgi:hypothetical protein
MKLESVLYNGHRGQRRFRPLRLPLPSGISGPCIAISNRPALRRTSIPHRDEIASYRHIVVPRRLGCTRSESGRVGAGSAVRSSGTGPFGKEVRLPAQENQAAGRRRRPRVFLPSECAAFADSECIAASGLSSPARPSGTPVLSSPRTSPPLPPDMDPSRLVVAGIALIVDSPPLS